MSKETGFFLGSGNVFADLNVTDADTELVKAEINYAIRSAKKRNLREAERGRMMPAPPAGLEIGLK